MDVYSTAGWYLTDHLGSVRYIVGNGGQVLASMGYDAYGQPIYVSGSAAGSILYAGYYYDWALGAYHDRARPYDPAIGRFWAQDPTGLSADSNPYRYTDNAPTDATDPTGKEATALGLTVFAPAEVELILAAEATAPLWLVGSAGFSAAAAISGTLKREIGAPGIYDDPIYREKLRKAYYDAKAPLSEEVKELIKFARKVKVSEAAITAAIEQKHISAPTADPGKWVRQD